MARPDVIADAVNYEVYLLHFVEPFGHARHYLGITNNLGRRLRAHQAGTGAVLLRHVRAAGIRWKLARTWDIPDGLSAREFEIRLKRQGSHARLCPICHPPRRQGRHGTS